MSASSVLILAGGRSRRFGRDKLQLDWHGEALRDHVIRRMREISDDVIVLAGHGTHETGEALGLRHVADQQESPGPLHAVKDGLALARHRACLVVAADMPLVPMNTFDLLLRTLEDGQHAVVGLMVDGRIEPLPVAVQADLVSDAVSEAIRAGSKRLGTLRDLPGAHGIPEVEWRRLDERGDSLRDIDTEDDLRLLLVVPSED